MLYDYQCNNCEHFLEDVYQKVNDDPLVTCPKCGQDALFRVITGGAYFIVKGTNTIGGLADKNTKENKSRIQEEAAKKKESQPQVNNSPSYHGSATNREIMKMTPQQQKKYIMEDKK